MTTRREFLGTMTALGATMALPGALRSSCGAAVTKIDKIGLQLYTVRDKIDRKSVV